MAMRIGGRRRKTRQLLRKHPRKQGKISINTYLQKFKEGDSVQLIAEPAVQKGIYHLDFYGKPGIVIGKQGTCYKVEIKDGGKMKCIIVHPVHLKKG
jgi:ribosomal protein L21E